MDDVQAAASFSALAHPDRMALLRHLVEAGPAGSPAGALAERLRASPSRTSFHLTALSGAGLVSARKEARNMIYQVEFAQLGALLQHLLHDCCCGDAALLRCCGFRC